MIAGGGQNYSYATDDGQQNRLQSVFILLSLTLGRIHFPSLSVPSLLPSLPLEVAPPLRLGGIAGPGRQRILVHFWRKFAPF